MVKKEYEFDTQLIHGAETPGEWLNATLPPVVQSAAHWFESAESLSAAFSGKARDPIYLRLHNPTNQVLERRLSALEAGAGAVVTSSGMAAIAETVLAICGQGSHVVASCSLFMSTYLLLSQVIKKFGIETTLVHPLNLEEWKAAIQGNTRLFYVETIGNPGLEVPLIQELAVLAHEHGLPLVVDNTLASPWLFQPLMAGADIVLHSTTKLLNGHGSAIGGVIIDGGRFPWPEERFPDFQPFKARAGNLAFLDRVWREIHINLGATAAPWHSFLTLLGIDTLALRVERQCQNALTLAQSLQRHPKVKWVRYPGLPDSPSHQNARRQFGEKGFGPLLTFGLEDQAACFEFIRRLKLVYHLANLGDCKTLIIHPWSSQYVNFPEEKRRELGITPDLLRVSVGIEAISDLISDFEQALAGV